MATTTLRRKPLNVRIDSGDMRELDRIARGEKEGRSVVVRRLLHIGLKETHQRRDDGHDEAA